MNRKILLSFVQVSRISQTRFASQTTTKVLGYKTKPNEDEITADFMGPPDKVSNIRPVLRYIPKNESKLQKELRLKRHEVHEWVNEFWTRHNEAFVREKNEFVTKNKPPGEDLIAADKMSEFYKAFLDKNWKRHFNFNLQWYKKNFNLLVLSFRVNLEQNLRKIQRK